MLSQNLSETLFKPKFDYPETSMISNSGVDLPVLSRHDPLLGFHKNFYRPIFKFSWVLSGGNALDIDEAIANVSVSKNMRNREKCFDTVKDYGPGNWIYEFNSIAQRRVTAAHACEEKQDLEGAGHNYRMAARYYAIASYPNLKSDVLALESDTLCRQTYKKVFAVSSSAGVLIEDTFTVSGKKVTGYLHLPDTKQIYPCVICVCTYEQSFSSFYRLFENHFKNAGIAMYVVEMPGIGACEKLNLNDHFSAVIEGSIEHLQTIKSVDSTNIGLFGSGIAGTACIRAAILHQQSVKALGLPAPYVHSFYTDPKILNSLPLCLRSSFCNRLDLDASNWDLVIPRFKAFSLKTQGLLSASGRCAVPTLICATERSVVTKDDIRMLENNFKDVSTLWMENEGYAMFIKTMTKSICSFFAEKFNS